MFKKVLVILLTLGLLIPALPANAELAGYREVRTNVPISAESVGYTTVLTNNLNANNTSLITEEKALESFRTAFPNQTKGLDLECEYQDWQRNGHPSWKIRIKGYDSGMEHRNNRQQVYVGGLVDGITGEALELTYRPSIEYYRDRNLSLNREQALPIATELLKKMHPDKISQLKLDDLQTKSYLFNNFQNGYSFTWKRVSEGLPVDWDSITIGIDAYSGIITQYNYTWHDMELPKANSIIDTKKVMDQLLQEQGLYLSYRRNPDNASSGLELTPVYSLNTTAYFVDAINGTLLDSRGKPVIDEKLTLFKQSFSPVNASLTVKETVIREKISIKEAMDKAQQFFAELGYNGEIRQSGSGGGSSFGYRDEFWYFSPK
ncbi:MAG: hypothetical protein PHT79_11445, partial [Syntrophomonadaceae bacterium]|nr:hypothetical protein [Syntrophomonadaceae bacterium]